MGYVIFVCFLIVVWLFFKKNREAGANFVRSYYYLLCLKNEKSIEDANYLARTILRSDSDPDFDLKLTQEAVTFSKNHFDGKQLPIIAEAQKRGFVK